MSGKEHRRVVMVSLELCPGTDRHRAVCDGGESHAGGPGHQVSVITGVPHYPEWRKTSGYNSFRPTTEVIDGVRSPGCRTTFLAGRE